MNHCFLWTRIFYSSVVYIWRRSSFSGPVKLRWGRITPGPRVKTALVTAMQGMEPISAALTELWVMPRKFHAVTRNRGCKNITSSSHLQGRASGHFIWQGTFLFRAHKRRFINSPEENVFTELNARAVSVPWWKCSFSCLQVYSPLHWSREKGACLFIYLFELYISKGSKKCKPRPWWVTILSARYGPSVGLFLDVH